ncbi:CBS domain-containing protein [Candidatus Woesearchaeota archaeon]|nr:CBS domain-containing protein [Candidatus Woesearchaeota archaeon]
MRVKDVMHSATKISSYATISEAARVMDEKLIGSLLAEEENKVVGIMTERDILRKIVAKGRNPDIVKVRDIMSSPILTIDANEGLIEASRRMDEKRIRRLVVTENGKIVGKITANSIARNFRYLLAKDTSEYSRPEY